MTHTGFSRADKATQFAAFLAGDSVARKRFPEMYHKGILKRTQFLMNLRGKDLSLGLAEDVVQCFWLSLLKLTPTAFHADSGCVDGFIDSRLLTAIRDVRAMYAPPGQRTRLPTKGSKAAQKRVHRTVSLDAPLPNLTNGMTLADVYKDPDDRILSTINRISAEQTLTFAQITAPPAVAYAIEMVYQESASLNQAAISIGVHHTALQRKIKTWVKLHRTALVA